MNGAASSTCTARGSPGHGLGVPGSRGHCILPQRFPRLSHALPNGSPTAPPCPPHGSSRSPQVLPTLPQGSPKCCPHSPTAPPLPLHVLPTCSEEPGQVEPGCPRDSFRGEHTFLYFSLVVSSPSFPSWKCLPRKLLKPLSQGHGRGLLSYRAGCFLSQRFSGYLFI